MKNKAALPVDPVALVRQLDADKIRERLSEMQRERAALLVLLRASLRRQVGQKGGTTDAPR
ncbi:MAG: hypothetical protein C0467_15895 [Planctomycetaceae bacterium]|nr:hypothetical protein [Planctomycetaceae bacterium]